MTKKELSVDEIAIAWLSEDLWMFLAKRGFKLRTVKLKSTGADWLLILSLYHDGEAFVGFVGGRTLVGVAKKLRKLLKEDKLPLRLDEYARGD